MTDQQRKPAEINANTIEALRWAIDQADEEIVALLNQRAEFARRIGVLKGASDSLTFVPARERAVLEDAVSVNEGPLPNDAIRGIFQQIIAGSRNLEQPVAVAYFGPEFTNTHAAAQQRFGTTARFVAANSIAEVINLVEHHAVQYGVVPIENSTEGVVRETLDSLYRSTLQIADELHVPVTHALWGNGTLDEVTVVYSHPQALGQCRSWLQTHLPRAEQRVSASTARAAAEVAGRQDAAAICHPLAAERYGLSLLAEHIEDSPYNRTRFCIIGQAASQPSGHDKTSIVFSVKHQAGSLNHALAVLERHGINLTLIESRPTKEMPWEYVFYLDIQGHITEPGIVAALAELNEQCSFLRVFGSYPEAM